MPASTSLRALSDAGLRAFAEGAFPLAAACFADALALDPDSVPTWSNLGSALLSAGDPEAAAGAFARALALDPSRPELHYNLGAALRSAGDPRRAASAYADAIALGLATAEAFNNLGLALADDARHDDAEAAFTRALTLDPRSASILVNLGNTFADGARSSRARACYEAALALDPAHVEARFNLFAALYDDLAPAPAERALDELLHHAPAHPAARFHRAALLAFREGPAAATSQLAELPPSFAHFVESLEHLLAQRSATTRLFTDGFRLLDHALRAAPPEGLVLELGVRRGTSLRFLAARAGGLVHGFDAFDGLPEEWRGVPRGAYSTEGELPDVPENARLHSGWFTDTLPPFLAAHPGPIRFVNVDCDLYSSARDALALLAPRFQPGTVLVFDDYFCNPGWQDDEHRALVETARAFGFAYDYLAASFFSRQAAVVLR